MRVFVECFGAICDHVPDAYQTLQFPSAVTLAQVLEQFIQNNGESLRTLLLAPQGEPLPNLVLTLNGVRVTEPKGMQRVVKNDGVIKLLLMPPFTGGG